MEKIKNSDWYINTLLKADFFDYGPVKGTIVFKPYAYKIWEIIQKIVDDGLKNFGIENTYFPLFIPEKFLQKEKEHLEGFSPEVAVVTFAGGEELEEKLIVRPTSETIMYPFFAKWIKSYRDLPLLINQWTNVIRWEKRPFPFIRNTEFLWHEGHTVHRSHKEAIDFALKILNFYKDIYQNYLGIFGYMGRKSKLEKFAGAYNTYTYEILLPDGKALQGCTSHDLGQNFSKPFEIKFQDKDKKIKYVWQTSFAITTRSIGAVAFVHGDEKGLTLPPSIAPIQIVIIPIYGNKIKIKKFLNKVIEGIKNYRIFFDDSDRTPGYKFNEWELKGVPLRIEIGEKEVNENKITLVRRDNKEKIKVAYDELKEKISQILEDIQKNLLEKSKKFTEENTHFVSNYKEFKKIIENERGFILTYFCENEKCETKIKEETKATTRCQPFNLNLNLKSKNRKCIYCNKRAKNLWLFAQSY